MSRPIQLAQNRQIVGQPNPDNRLAEGVSPGFQRQVMADGQLPRRDFLRASLSGTTASAIYTDPISRADIKGFRNDAVTCCLEMASVTRTSNAPVLIQLQQFQANSVRMSAAGTTTGNGHDTVLGCVTPNQANMFMPNPGTSGAQLQLSNILNNPLYFGITDLQGQPITDLTGYYFSLVFWERLPPGDT